MQLDKQSPVCSTQGSCCWNTVTFWMLSVTCLGLLWIHSSTVITPSTYIFMRVDFFCLYPFLKKIFQSPALMRGLWARIVCPGRAWGNAQSSEDRRLPGTQLDECSGQKELDLAQWMFTVTYLPGVNRGKPLSEEPWFCLGTSRWLSPNMRSGTNQLVLV